MGKVRSASRRRRGRWLRRRRRDKPFKQGDQVSVFQGQRGHRYDWNRGGTYLALRTSARALPFIVREMWSRCRVVSSEII